MTYVVPDFITVTLGFAVFIIGASINAKVGFLRRFNIPEPVSGGLLVSGLVFGVYALTNVEIEFELQTRDFFLVVFFAAIGLNARLSDLLAGGKPLAILVGLTVATILMQNIIGVVGATAFGYPAQAGVLFGSASLIGGHGTALAWSPEVMAKTGLVAAEELGVAVATLGLVLAALIGGPIAGRLIARNHLTPRRPDAPSAVGLSEAATTAVIGIDPLSLMRAMLYINLAIVTGFVLSEAISSLGLKLPLFVPCLIMGILIANVRTLLRPKAPAVTGTPALAIISEFALGAFLAMSLMSLQLWTLASLGIAIAVILALQTVAAGAFVLFVLFPLLGRDYRAAVLAAGFAGFSLGATPTAIANMTAVTKRYGPSPIAFVVLPLVSAFFVDLANAVVIQTILSF